MFFIHSSWYLVIYKDVSKSPDPTFLNYFYR